MKIRRGIFAFLFLSLLFIPSILYSYNAPDPVRSFYGDATGDMSVAGDDLSSHRMVASGGSATYATTQPQTGGQYWNTCDLSGDGSCAGDDIPSLFAVASGGTTLFSLSGWEISNYDLNETGNSVGISYPFRLNVAAGAIGRPGIIIKVTIAADSPVAGSLVGRTCTPGSDPDELNTSDDQCAVAVTVTDFYGDSSIAPTESGTTGLQIQADAAGTIHLLAEVVAQDNLLVPAMTLDLYPHFENPILPSVSIDCSNPGPNPVDELSAMQCTVIATSAPEVDTTNDTCGGEIGGTGPWTYDFTPTEEQGPDSCVAAVELVSDASVKSSGVVDINEVNVAPTITVDCPASANETDGITCPLTASDLDVPAQNLTCSITSCSGGVKQTVPIGSGTSNTTFAVGTNYHDERTQVIYLASEIGSAEVISSLAINIFRLPRQTMNNFTIRMKHTSLSYYDTASWEDSSSWTTVYQSNLTITSTGWNTFTFTTPFSYNGTDNLMVDFSFNNDSLSSYGNSRSTHGTTNRTISRQSNSDYGDPLTWSGTTPTPYTSKYTPNIKLTFDGCFGATLIGCSSLYIPANSENVGPGTINVTVEVQDSYGATGEGSDSIDILEVNIPPVNNAPASVTGDELTAISFSTSPTDSDIPVQTLTSSVVSATGACTNGIFSGNTWSWTPTEEDGPTSCDVITRVYDGVDYSADKTTHVKVSEVNVAPVNNATSSVSGTVLNPISFDVNPTDDDVPIQTLTCSQVSNSCLGGSLSGCTWSWTPGTLEGPTSCNVVTRVYDGVAYSSDITTKVIVTNGGNTAPTITVDCPESANETDGITCPLTASDLDVPAQNLTCSITSCTGGAGGGAGGGVGERTATIGDGTTTTNTALGANNHDERSQLIYLASEIGAAGVISSLAINVTQLPGQTLNNFTIRMKHTSLSYFDTASWEDPSTWTTVYQSNLTITSTGWNIFTFTTPFSYNGTDNLMVDFSFNNTSSSTMGLCYNTQRTTYRHVYKRVDSTYGDPLSWTGTTSPSPGKSKYTPNVKLTISSGSCLGVNLSGCSSLYIPAQGESSGPGTINVTVGVQDSYGATGEGSDSIAILEVNTPPVNNASASVIGNELTAISFGTSPTDSDLPAQTLTSSVVSATGACTKGTLSDHTWSWTPTEEDGPTSCDVITRVYDGVDYSADKTTHVKVSEVNVAPVNNATSSVSGTVLNPISFDVNPTDDDVPIQTLTCSQVSNSCLGGSLSGCSWSWTPALFEGPTSCNVVTRVYDGVAYGSNKTTKVIVTDGGNTAPTITVDCPESANETDGITCPLTASDLDIPAQNLTCSIASCTAAGVEQTVTIGDGTIEINSPLGTNNHDERAQVIYLASEIGAAGLISSLAINVTQIPGQTMNNFTIRMKHTSYIYYIYDSWEAPSGWTTVYQNNLTITSTGWNKFTFTTPFSYDGTSNLMVDFSFNNDSYSTYGLCEGTDRPMHRHIYKGVYSTYGDPLDWTGRTSPIPVKNIYTPNIKLTISNDACVGIALTGCSSLYIPAQGENVGPGKLSITVGIEDSCGATGSGSDSVDILEVNIPPVNNAPASVTGDELTAISFSTSPTDSDVPAQTLTSSVVSSTGACSNGSFTGNIWSWTPSEADGPTSCDVITRVYDGVDYSTDKTTHIIVYEVNVAPVDNAPVSVSGTVLNPISFDINPTDSDIPMQTLTCSQISNSCLGGSLSDCAWSWTPALLEGPVSCNVVTRVYDGVAYSSDITTKVIVTNGGNTTPTNNAPATVTGVELTVISFNTNPTDPESPPQTLTSSVVSATGACTNGSFTGHTWNWTPTEVQGPTSCNVVTQVFDGVVYSSSITTKIIVNEANVAPTWQTQPNDLSLTSHSIFNLDNGRGSDSDIPAQTLTCSKISQTCSFPVTVSGSGSGSTYCHISFESGAAPETCDVDVQVTDSSGASVSDSFQISVVRDHMVWYVNDDASGAQTGLTWEDAFITVQEGVDAAMMGDMVWVAEGSYGKLTMKEGVSIYGGFIGDESSLDERLDPADYPTTLKNEDTVTGIPGASNSRLDGFYITRDWFWRYGLMSNLSVSNLIVENNVFNDSPDGIGDGGGIYNYDSSLTITNCVFSGNIAYNGSGIYNYSSSPTITNCVFSGNWANDYYGGGIYNYSSSPTITNCTFSGNSAELGGGGIANVDNSSPTITNCTFSGNSAGLGGGIYNLNSLPTITNCVFSGNRSGIYNGSSSPIITNCVFSGNSTWGNGGGIYNNNYSSPTITNCVFSGNSTSVSGGGGGISNCSYASPIITNCVFSGNSAGYGGGMYNVYNSSPIITNCTFSGNIANHDEYSGGYGGGMCNYNYSSPTITNCTFTGNSAYSGGGIYNKDSSPTITNVIMWGDTVAGRPEIENTSSSPNVTYSDIQGGYTGTGNIDSDPLFVSTTDFHLTLGTPCINTGTNTGAPAYDLDGNPRPSPVGGTVDMGAYEYQFP